MEDGYPIAKARLRLFWGKAAIDPKLAHLVNEFHCQPGDPRTFGPF